jgi:hypothetical protein
MLHSPLDAREGGGAVSNHEIPHLSRIPALLHRNREPWFLCDRQIGRFISCECGQYGSGAACEVLGSRGRMIEEPVHLRPWMSQLALHPDSTR